MDIYFTFVVRNTEGYTIIEQPAGPASVVYINWLNVSGVTHTIHASHWNKCVYCENVYTVKWGWPILFRKGNAASLEVPIAQGGKIGLVESTELGEKKKNPLKGNNKRGSKKK